jgi:hypothetical protein
MILQRSRRNPFQGLPIFRSQLISRGITTMDNYHGLRGCRFLSCVPEVVLWNKKLFRVFSLQQQECQITRI